MTGRRNRAHAPSRFLPPRPSPPFGFLYGSKKLDTEDFKLQRTAARFSANIIWLLFYLFAKSYCLRKQPPGFKIFAIPFRSRAEPAKRSN